MSETLRCELLVVGAGPAGVAAALQAVRDGLEVLLVGDEPVGGLVRAARWVENLPALFPGVRGPELAERLVAQLEAWRIAPRYDKVLRLERAGEGFVGSLAGGDRVEAGSVVLATGTEPTHYAPAGLEACREQGLVHRDLRTLPELRQLDEVLVVGGGDAALDTALSLRDRGTRVTLAVRGKQLRATPRLAEAAVQAGVLVRLRCVVVALKPGAGRIAASLHVAGEGARERSFDAMLACVGREPRDRLLAPLGLSLTEPAALTTRLPGLYLAGDLIRARQRYVATAFGDGQRAALLAASHLQSAQRRRGAQG